VLTPQTDPAAICFSRRAIQGGYMLKRLSTSIIITMWVVVGIGVVKAQDAHKFQVEIPFPFVLQDRGLPAGKYRLERIDPAKPNLLMIRNDDAHLVRLILTQRVAKEAVSSTTYLLFRRREEKLYLFQVWISGALNGIQIPLPDNNDTKVRRDDGTSVVRLNAKAP